MSKLETKSNNIGFQICTRKGTHYASAGWKLVLLKRHDHPNRRQGRTIIRCQ